MQVHRQITIGEFLSHFRSRRSLTESQEPRLFGVYKANIPELQCEPGVSSQAMNCFVLLLFLLNETIAQAAPSWPPSPEDCRALCREGEDGEMSKKFDTAVCFTKYCLATGVFQEIQESEHILTIWFG